MLVEAGKVHAQTNFHTLEAIQPGR